MKFMGSRLIIYVVGRPQTYTMVLNRTGRGESIHDIAEGDLTDMISGLRSVKRADLVERPEYRNTPAESVKALEKQRQNLLAA